MLKTIIIDPDVLMSVDSTSLVTEPSCLTEFSIFSAETTIKNYAWITMYIMINYQYDMNIVVLNSSIYRFSDQ